MKRAMQIGTALLAVLAVAGIGWNGWEQHRQTEELQRQSCLADAAAQNSVSEANFALLFPNGLKGLPEREATSTLKARLSGFDRVRACD